MSWLSGNLANCGLSCQLSPKLGGNLVSDGLSCQRLRS